MQQCLNIKNGQVRSRYDTLDALKAICAFFVVCIHAPFPGKFGEYYLVLMRIAVPVFFNISGFFYSPDNCLRQLKKLFRMMICSNAVYFLFEIGKAAIKGEVELYLLQVFTKKNLAQFIIFNKSPFAPHLWYLGAIIYSLFIFHLFEKMNCKNVLYIFIPFLLAGDLMLGKYSIFLFGRQFPYIFVRNWLFVGIPYFSLGALIREHHKSVLHVGKAQLVCAIFFFSMTALLEKWFLDINSINTMRDHYISTTFTEISVFLLFTFYMEEKRTLLSNLGRNYSLGIYVFHYMIISLLGYIVPFFGMFIYLKPLLVYIITAVFINIWRVARNSLKNYIRSK